MENFEDKKHKKMVLKEKYSKNVNNLRDTGKFFPDTIAQIS